MKVFLVQSLLGKKDDGCIYPLGISYIATAIADAHEVRAFDPNTSSDPHGELRRLLREFAPDVVGISLRNIDSQGRIDIAYYYKHFQAVLATAREAAAGSVIIVGGTGFSMFAQKIMERNPAIDLGVYLEAEESFPELLANLATPERVKGIYYRREGRVMYTGFRPAPDFAALPMPRRDFLDFAPYTRNFQSIGIQTRRGCPLKCSYCNYPDLNGNKVRCRSVKSVCDEIEQLVNKYGLKSFYFADAVFNTPVKYATELCNEIIKRGIRVKWSAYLDIRAATREFMHLARKAGCCSVVFSPDAISQSALDGLRKGLKEHEVWASLKMFSKDPELKDVEVIYSVFINTSGETLAGLFKTIYFYIRGKTLLLGRGNVFVNWIRLEPDTESLRMALKKGEIRQDLELLPEDPAKLKDVFYSKPGLSWADPAMMALFRVPAALKSVLIKLGLKKRRGIEV